MDKNLDMLDSRMPCTAHQGLLLLQHTRGINKTFGNSVGVSLGAKSGIRDSQTGPRRQRAQVTHRSASPLSRRSCARFVKRLLHLTNRIGNGRASCMNVSRFSSGFCPDGVATVPRVASAHRSFDGPRSSRGRALPGRRRRAGKVRVPATLTCRGGRDVSGSAIVRLVVSIGRTTRLSSLDIDTLGQ